MAKDLIKPFNGDPFVGHLSTPISDSEQVHRYLKKLPIYRPGLTPLQRGLEIGTVHGFFLIGPFAELGPLRNSDFGNLAALGSTVALIFIAKAGMRLYGLAVFPKEGKAADVLQTYDGWKGLAQGFMKGGIFGALVAFILLEIFRLFGF